MSSSPIMQPPPKQPAKNLQQSPKKKKQEEEKDNNPDKITRKQAFRALLTDEELSDITLHGKDGSIVHANRCMLASRSSGTDVLLNLNWFKSHIWRVTFTF